MKNRRICELKGRTSLDLRTLYASGWRGLAICLVGAGLGLLVNAISPRGLPLLGPVPAFDTKGIERIALEEAWALFREDKGVFVDARSAEEFRAGHIPRALLLPLHAFEETVSSWTNLIPADTLLITYCSGEECESSTDVAALLVEEGYSQVKVLFGGWEHWKRAGYPVETVGQKGPKPDRDSRLHSNRGLSLREGG
jgi:rhodanese-related sulfurtransferase